MADEDRARWDARWSRASEGRAAPAWLDELDDELPRRGRALDVAAGTGRVALWMAARGLVASAVDVSPVGLAIAADAACAAGLALETIALDLEAAPLPDGPFHLIACFHYRQPALFAAMRKRLAPGGVLVAELATVQNLERHARPSRRWLAEPNELLAAAEGLFVAYYREAWLDDRHVARLAARRP